MQQGKIRIGRTPHNPRAIGEQLTFASVKHMHITAVRIGQYMVRADPDFDSRTYGAAKLSDLIKGLPKRFEVRKDANAWLVRDIA